MNLPNSISLSRICFVPLLIWMLSPHFFFQGPHGEQEILASLLFIAAAITDTVDGHLARSRGQVTTMGMLLDPLADKMLVSAAFICLVQFNPHVMKAWVAVLVIGREFLVSGLRSIASTEGLTIQASNLGKFKTVTQIVTVVAIILAHRWDAWHFGWFIMPVYTFAVAATYFMVTVSTISAVDYFWAFWKKIDHQATTRRVREDFVLSRHKKPAKNLG